MRVDEKCVSDYISFTSIIFIFCCPVYKFIWGKRCLAVASACARERIFARLPVTFYPRCTDNGLVEAYKRQQARGPYRAQCNVHVRSRWNGMGIRLYGRKRNVARLERQKSPRSVVTMRLLMSPRFIANECSGERQKQLWISQCDFNDSDIMRIVHWFVER